jgi:hypothetical protein
MNLRAVHNAKFGEWRICHDQWCERGETSIVATITTTLDDAKDAELARLICERFNAVEAEAEFTPAAPLMTKRKSLVSERAELVAYIASRRQHQIDPDLRDDLISRVQSVFRLAAQDQKPVAKIECPNCHDANKYGDYEGPACEVCLGDGFISPPPAAGWDGGKGND